MRAFLAFLLFCTLTNHLSETSPIDRELFKKLMAYQEAYKSRHRLEDIPSEPPVGQEPEPEMRAIPEEQDTTELELENPRLEVFKWVLAEEASHGHNLNWDEMKITMEDIDRIKRLVRDYQSSNNSMLPSEPEPELRATAEEPEPTELELEFQVCCRLAADCCSLFYSD